MQMQEVQAADLGVLDVHRLSHQHSLHAVPCPLFSFLKVNFVNWM